MEREPETYDSFVQLALFGLEKIAQRRFEYPQVTEVEHYIHRITPDNFIQDLGGDYGREMS